MTEYSKEWLAAESAVEASLGFKVVFRDDHKVSPYITVNVDHDGNHIQQTPTTKRVYDLWCEAVRYRLDHQGACKLAWDVYAAATGQNLDNFNGMPAGEPAAHVKAERQRLLALSRGYHQELCDVYSEYESQVHGPEMGNLMRDIDQLLQKKRDV